MGRFSKWLCADMDIADSESISDDMTSGEALWWRAELVDRFLGRMSAGIEGSELRRRGRDPWKPSAAASPGIAGTGGGWWRVSMLPAVSSETRRLQFVAL